MQLDLCNNARTRRAVARVLAGFDLSDARDWQQSFYNQEAISFSIYIDFPSQKNHRPFGSSPPWACGPQERRRFPRQREFIQFLYACLRAPAHGLIEKSRDMGATWLACAFSV
jgi:hypothetical protein